MREQKGKESKEGDERREMRGGRNREVPDYFRSNKRVDLDDWETSPTGWAGCSCCSVSFSMLALLFACCAI